MQALRDDPTCADEEQAGRVRADNPGPLGAPDVRPERGRRGAAARARRRAPPGGDPARAGGQRPDRDGGRLRSRRLRRGRRPHDRSAVRRHRPARASKGWPPAAGSPTATCSAPGSAGRSRSCSSRAPRELFAGFFARPDTFALGVCNGCQMLSALKEIIPGAEAWPRFVRNRSDQFEARLAMVEVATTPSVLLAGMAGSRLPIAVAHGEGRVEFAADADGPELEAGGLVAARFVDHRGPRDGALPREPERLVPRHHRRHHHRRSGHAVHAAPRARVPRRPVLLAPGRLAEDGPWMRSSGTRASSSADARRWPRSLGGRRCRQGGGRRLVGRRGRGGARAGALRRRGTRACSASRRRLAWTWRSAIRLPHFDGAANLHRQALAVGIARVSRPALAAIDPDGEHGDGSNLRHRNRQHVGLSELRETPYRAKPPRTCASRLGVTSLAVIPWPPRSMHGFTSCIGQLSRPSALLTATIAAIISFETSGASLPGVGAPRSPPSKPPPRTPSSSFARAQRHPEPPGSAPLPRG